MLLSIFTPTNDPRWLVDCYRSLQEQPYKAFEWVVIPNGPDCGKIVDSLRTGVIAADERVRVHPSNLQGIGALKKFACMLCKGDLLIELDHDDLLTPECLHTLVETHEKVQAGFYYSDCLDFYPDHTSQVYDACYGWQSYPHRWQDRDYTVMKSFPITPRSLCEIFYAPNHVRVWSRSAYATAGGHNADLSLGDDHDLLCRTYLAGIKFHYIPRVLYVYRRHDTNHCVVNVGAIAKQQLANMNKYIHPLIFEWCKRQDLKMLDLGGAHHCPKELGFLAVDRHNGPTVDLVADVTKHLPVLDDSVGCFRAHDFMEHIPIPEVVPFMNRLYSKLAPGGWLISKTPSVTGPGGEVGRGAYQDPTHVSFWSENNFWYYTDRGYANFVPEIQCRFQNVRIWTDWPSPWHFQHKIPYVFADLLAIKGDMPVPGGCQI